MVQTPPSNGTDGSSLKFGIFDWIDRNDLALGDIYEDRLKLLEFADTAGFYAYHLAEHHATPLSIAPSPGIFLAAAAQRTSRIRLGALVFLLPLYSPLRLAQEICMLDHLTRGRLEFGVGRGISPNELAFFNVDPAESRVMFQEALTAITSGLTTGRMSSDGEYFRVNDVRLHIEPMQKPYPPLWYPTENPESMRWVAEQGFNTMVHYPSLEKIRELFDLYKSVWQESKDNPSRLNAHEKEPKYGITRHVYVADTDAKAMAEAKEAFATFIHNFNYLRVEAGGTSGRPEYLADFEARMEDGYHIVGSPGSVREQLKAHVEATGCNYFAGSFFFGTLSFEQTMNSLQLFAREVIPAFAEA